MRFLRRLARHPKWLVLGAAALAVAALAAYPFLAPKASTQLDQAPLASATTLASGPWQDGEPGHTASGRASIQRDASGAHFLRLDDYQATAGPDVYFYLTPVERPRTTAEVEGGLRVLVPGGAEDGEATLRGDFHVALPADFDPARYRGIAAWCDRFDVLFGWATLTPAG